MIKVLHSTTFPAPARWPDDYKLVAEVDTDDKDVAFEKTNHTDHDWTSNPGVTPITDGVTNVFHQHRSTSVGDVMQLETGRLWRVENIGWLQLADGSEPNEPVHEDKL